MISHSERHKIVKLIRGAKRRGSRLSEACKVIGISSRTFQRWTQNGKIKRDMRPFAQRPEPKNKLSPEEKNMVLQTCYSEKYGSLPPSQIVPMLADKQIYIASESTMYRVLRAAGAQHQRGRSKARRKKGPAASHKATGPNQVWCWDITWLPGPVRGIFYYLYMIEDVWSRKIIAWEVYDRESSENAAALMERAVLKEGIVDQPLILHADNGSPQKGYALLHKLYSMGITPSYSRPRVSNDNAYIESLFKTLKYIPKYPTAGFASISAARSWIFEFVTWYNTVHRHSKINFVTPESRHNGSYKQILEKRKQVYRQAKAQNPHRWSKNTRNWNPVEEVELNPLKEPDSQKQVA